MSGWETDSGHSEGDGLATLHDLEEGDRLSLGSTISGLAEEEGGRVNLQNGETKNGLAQLVLILVKMLHELLEKQAIRRMESKTLSDDEIERLGMTLMKQAEELERMRKEFGLEEEDLNLDLGPLGKLL